MKTRPYEGPGPRGTKVAHAAQAPWPTCSCQVCREARHNADADPFTQAVERIAAGTYGLPPRIRAVIERESTT